MARVLFVSENPLGRCENLTKVYHALDCDKEFRLHHYSMRNAEREGFDAVVFDALPIRIEGKSHCRTFSLGHGIEGGKLYGYDEGDRAPWFDPVASAQTDYAIAASEKNAAIVAKQLCLPEERVLPLGFPRTDDYFGVRRPGHDGRVYLYAPTFRNGDGHLPRIDWGKVDGLLGDDETLIVKRHYYDGARITDGAYRHIVEQDPSDASFPYLVRCDVLLTDYSSIVFDAYLLGVPAVLTVDDKDEYLAVRGMYYPYPSFYSSRWLRAEGNEEDLLNMLREAAQYGMGDAERECIRTVAGACDGHSTERVCELIRNTI